MEVIKLNRAERRSKMTKYSKYRKKPVVIEAIQFNGKNSAYIHDNIKREWYCRNCGQKLNNYNLLKEV